MMTWLRKIVNGIFGFQAAALLPALPLGFYFFWKQPHRDVEFALRFLMIVGSLSLVGAVYAMACWSNKTGRAWPKVWGTIASAINLLVGTAVFLIPSFRVGLSLLWLLPVSGVAGLWINLFESVPDRSSVKKEDLRSIKGDGTFELLNKIAPVIGYIQSLAVYLWWTGWCFSNHIPRSYGLLRYGWVLIILFVVVTLHELGHMLIGLGFGMKLRSFAAGPFQWRIRDGKWEFTFKPGAIFAPEGAVGVVPYTFKEDDLGSIAVTLAGPIVNLLIAAVALGLALTTDGRDPIQAEGLLALFGAFNLTTGLFNLIPLRTNNNYSDGAQIYQKISGGPFADLHRALAAASSTLVTPLRPRDYDMQAIGSASQSFREGDRALLLRLLATSHYFDCEMTAEALQSLKEAETIFHESASDVPGQLLTAIVFYVAFLRRDQLGAREWWNRMEAKKDIRANADYWLAQSALCWIEGNLAYAHEMWHKGAALAVELPAAGAYESDRHKFVLLREVIDASIEEEKARSAATHVVELRPAQSTEAWLAANGGHFWPMQVE